MEVQTNIKGFISYFRYVTERRIKAKSNCQNYDISLKHLETFIGSNEVSFNKITIAWLDRLKNYFNKAKALKCGKPLSTNSVNTYLLIIISVAREAANDRLIDPVIVNRFKISQPRIQAESSALSLTELQKLATTDCSPKDLKKAFLFSCLTGLHWKDIETLKWNQIKYTSDDNSQITLHRDVQMLIPLSLQARELIGNGGHGDKLVFNINYSTALRVSLAKWVLRAGLTRTVTFHSARQTFGRMLLNQGVEPELISELLGHKHLKTTIKFLSVNSSNLIGKTT